MGDHFFSRSILNDYIETLIDLSFDFLFHSIVIKRNVD